MATLTSKQIRNTYKDLLQVSNSNAGVDATRRDVEDGEGTVSALSLSTVAAKITGDLEVTGDLTVSGTTTTIDSTTIAVKTAFVFEGATADAFETTLQVTDPTADRTLTLPNATGTIALIENKLSVFAATTSSELLGVISDETGTGALVFAGSPTFTGTIAGASQTLSGTLGVTGATTLTGGATIGNTLTVNANYKGVFNSSVSGKSVMVYGASGTHQWDIYGNSTNLRISDNDSTGVVQIDTGATIGGTLGVTGATTLSSTLAVGGSVLTKMLNIKDSSNNNTSQISFRDLSSSSGFGYLGNFSNSVYLTSAGTYANGWVGDGALAIAGIVMTSANLDSSITLQTSSANATSPTTRMTILNNGNVGIGTTLPANKLHVYGSSPVRVIADTTGQYAVFNLYESGTERGAFYIDTTANTTILEAGTLHDLTFNVPSVTNAMVIKQTTGNVGIGTTSPATKLQIETSAGDGFKFSEDSDGGGYYGEFIVDGGGLKLGTTSGVRDVQFRVGSATKMIIDTAGNVGIGTTSPSEKLHVDGFIKTSAPTTGTSGSWKLGVAVTTTSQVIKSTQYIQVDIGGTLYRLAIAETAV